jgi:tetratricopeptide (TPR) repeat protein
MIFPAVFLVLFACACGFAESTGKGYSNEAALRVANGNKSTEVAQVYLRMGETAEVRGDFPAAEALFKEARDVLERGVSADDSPRVATLDDLGWLYVTWGKMAEGSRLMDEAQAQAERMDPEDPRLIKHWDTQAAYLVVARRYSEARKDWTHALEIGKLNYGPDSPRYAALLVHLGQASSIYGDYKTAEEMFQRFLTLASDNNRETQEARAVAQGELAHVYVELHRYSEARPLFDKSLAAFQNDPDGAPLVRSMILSYLGDWYMEQSEWDKAQLQYREAVNIQQRVLGGNNVVASDMVALSRALKKLHRKNEAKEWMTRARAILIARRQQLPQDTVDVLALRGE